MIGEQQTYEITKIPLIDVEEEHAAIGVDARTAARAQPAFSLKNISHNFPEYRTSVLPIYENSAGEAALQ